jgi:hypothetical protein
MFHEYPLSSLPAFLRFIVGLAKRWDWSVGIISRRWGQIKEGKVARATHLHFWGIASVLGSVVRRARWPCYHPLISHFIFSLLLGIQAFGRLFLATNCVSLVDGQVEAEFILLHYLA